MKINNLITSGFIGLLVLASCDNTDPINVFEENNIPQNIENDFYARYGNVKVTDAVNYSYDGHITIDFKDEKGLLCESIYMNGEWIMSTTDLGANNFFANLPEKVYRSFRELRYSNPLFDIIDNTNRVYEIKRKGIDHEVYDFRFHIERPNGSFTPIQVLINEDGLVLLDTTIGYNKQEQIYWTTNSPYSIINSKYPEADIRSYANCGGKHLFYILHDGRIKTVQFISGSSDFVWEETTYKLDSDFILPVQIVESYIQRKANGPVFHGSSFDTILFKETETGCLYGLQDTKREDNVTFWISANIEDL